MSYKDIIFKGEFCNCSSSLLIFGPEFKAIETTLLQFICNWFTMWFSFLNPQKWLKLCCTISCENMFNYGSSRRGVYMSISQTTFV